MNRPTGNPWAVQRTRSPGPVVEGVTSPMIRECVRCRQAIVTGQRYDGWTAQGLARAEHSSLVGCLTAMLVRASRRLGG